MTKEAFDQIAEGLMEALAISEGRAEPYRLYVPAEINVKAIRAELGMTQKDFAAAYGFSLDQVKQWEQGRSRPLEGMRAYLLLIQKDPRGILASLKQI